MKVHLLIAFLAFMASQILAQDSCTPLRCTLPLKPGDCTEEIPQYYFDSVTKRCKKFIYSGCNGNVNRFRTLELCEVTCKRPCSTTTTTTKAPITTTPCPP